MSSTRTYLAYFNNSRHFQRHYFDKDGGEYRMHDPYYSHGFNSRTDYLLSLADEYDVPQEVVMALADVLGPNEDFDGLITSLEDSEGYF